ncbi:hypothetical protein EMQ25_17735 [Arsenicitalea aurantiaca]|uniref:Uncharacterized protein n=1 Tax=Arsenicitalea aurantiaca TaxID=1783274 RepID=A0A433X2A6_9HYPH|nr:hypothetical protein EMQ25_17735 [Arsenicitalea aurantiaca]
MSRQSRTLGPVLLSPNEMFWLDVIRMSSGYSDPAPTLWRTQRLRQLFSDRFRTRGSDHDDEAGA